MKSGNSARRIKKILCPTDFSRESQKAVEYAARLAVACDAPLYVYHCAGRRDVLLPEKIEDFNESISAVIVKATADNKDLRWQGFIAEGADEPARNITAFAREIGVDIIVMKSRYHPVSAHLFGSTIQRTVQTAPCPVLLLPFEWESAELNYRQILVNYDFSTEACGLLDYAKTFAGNFNAEIHLLHLLSPESTAGIELSHTSAGEKVVRRAVCERLREVILADTDNSYQITGTIGCGKSTQAMLEYAEEKKIDLICATAPGQRFYFETLFPTWLERILRDARCPLLVSQATVNRSTSKPFSTSEKDVAFAG